MVLVALLLACAIWPQSTTAQRYTNPSPPHRRPRLLSVAELNFPGRLGRPLLGQERSSISPNK